MIGALSALARPVFGAIDPERAHDLAISSLKLAQTTGVLRCAAGGDDPRLAVGLFGLAFPNPLGMAAGFDKHGEVPDALVALGFGFAEIGTVAPRPQPGNPRPRVFRLAGDRAVINRYGFNTQGHDAVRAHLEARRGHGVLGVNIGANKDASDRAADYVAGVDCFAGIADYFTVNISSPNTPGLRDLQHEQALEDLLSRVSAARDRQADRIGRPVPLLLKIAPDLEDPDLDGIAGAVTRHRFDGVIVSNTTLSRVGLSRAGISDRHASEAGGLSGRPLFRRSTVVLARLRRRLASEIPIVGVGGIDSAETAYEKIRAGAALVQVYTGLVYGGLGLVGDIKRGLVRQLDRDGFGAIGDAVGTATEDWARERIE